MQEHMGLDGIRGLGLREWRLGEPGSMPCQV